jgi:UDP:flavonoid glycosyltransferase YjiC (YdhE family)
MRITLLTTGTVGDVQPFVALGEGLRAAGHQVLIAAPKAYGDLVRGRALGFSPLAGDPRELIEDNGGRKPLTLEGNPLRFLREAARRIEPVLVRLFHDALRSCQGADVVLCGPTVPFITDALAQKLRRPVCLAGLVPLGPTRFEANFLVPPLPRGLRSLQGGAFNRLTHWVVLQGSWLIFRRAVNRARRRVFGLPPRPALLPRTLLPPGPVLYGFSPEVVSPPADWPAHHRVTGYWFLDRAPDWQPPARLRDFLQAGPPPVYVGFGSMRDRDPEALARLVLQALARAGQRGILSGGWEGLGRLQVPGTILVLTESVPHDWLFPHMSAVVHHGGAGTTAAGLRAGVPTVVVPYFFDQPFWGRRVRDLGVGPAPLPRNRLTAGGLAAAIRRAADDPLLRSRAADLGARIRAENGVARAVEALEQVGAGLHPAAPACGARTIPLRMP